MVENNICVPDFLTDHSASATWMDGMAAAATYHKLPMQWCMASPTDLMQALNYPSVTNLRASTGKYHSPSPSRCRGTVVTILYIHVYILYSGCLLCSFLSLNHKFSAPPPPPSLEQTTITEARGILDCRPCLSGVWGQCLRKIRSGPATRLTLPSSLAGALRRPAAHATTRMQAASCI